MERKGILTPLCKVGYKYGTDKTPYLAHVYTPFYYHRWKDRREEIKKVLEIGVAGPGIMRGIPHYQTGASLKMWRDFFPNAQIYGIDIVPRTMLEGEDRIETFLVDSTNEQEVGELIDKIGSDIDIIIDDGDHSMHSQMATARNFKKYVQRNVDYIIEDVGHNNGLMRALAKDFDTESPELPMRLELQMLRTYEGRPLKNANKLVIVHSKPTQYEVSPKMKNLMIWISGTGGFNAEAKTLIKIQIENSLRLGWRKEDILLVTNFPYEYMGVKAIQVKGDYWIGVRPRSINTTAIPGLVKEGIIEDGYIYWNHDVDAFQLQTISPEELGLDDYDAGFTDYGWKPRWCMGSFFVKSSIAPFIEALTPIVESDIEDEDAVQMTMEKYPEMAKRIKRMNVAYNMGQRKVDENARRANGNPKVAHFHPHKRNLMDVFAPYMPHEMLKIFEKHGFKHQHNNL